MKVNNVANIEKFFGVVDSCEGRVDLILDDNSVMNLKSKLSQIVSLTKVFSLNGVIPELEIITHTPSDAQRMIAFMTNNR